MLKINKIRPTWTKIITTAERYDSDQKTGSLVDAKKLEGRYKEYQTVVRVGSSVKEVKEGEVVVIDPSRYVRRKYDENSLRDEFGKNPQISIEIPTIVMGEEDYFMIDQADIAYVIEDFEEISEPEITVKSNLILPKEKKIITN